MVKCLLICLLLLATALGAQNAILGVPISNLKAEFPARDLRASDLQLSQAGYSVLH